VDVVPKLLASAQHVKKGMEEHDDRRGKTRY